MIRTRRRITAALALACALLLCASALSGCGGRGVENVAQSGGQPAAGAAAGTTAPTAPGPLPDEGYRAQITLLDAPARMRAGQKQTINVNVRNTSNVTWIAPHDQEGNKYVIAVMNSWLQPDGTLATNMDGRYGVQRDLAPGEEAELPLVITAPKNPGDYILELDMVQEQVTFFKDKGSQPLRVNVKVE
ncbi:MAG TPA: hypothetical protein VF240_19715 [Pyrinomonadaceae bacterium]